METQKTLYVFKIKYSQVNGYFEYMGEILTEASVFAESEAKARAIIVKELGFGLINRLVLDSEVPMRLYGKRPHGNEIMVDSSLIRRSYQTE